MQSITLHISVGLKIVYARTADATQSSQDDGNGRARVSWFLELLDILAATHDTNCRVFQYDMRQVEWKAARWR